jgi:hypothetical protein
MPLALPSRELARPPKTLIAFHSSFERPTVGSDLEAEVKYQQERVERAEQWLHRREPPSRSNALAHLVSH